MLLKIVLLGAFLSMLQVHVVADNISNSDNRIHKQIERWWQNEKRGNADIQYVSHRIDYTPRTLKDSDFEKSKALIAHYQKSKDFWSSVDQGNITFGGRVIGPNPFGFPFGKYLQPQDIYRSNYSYPGSTDNYILKKIIEFGLVDASGNVVLTPNLSPDDFYSSFSVPVSMFTETQWDELFLQDLCSQIKFDILATQYTVVSREKNKPVGISVGKGGFDGFFSSVLASVAIDAAINRERSINYAPKESVLKKEYPNARSIWIGLAPIPFYNKAAGWSMLNGLANPIEIKNEYHSLSGLVSRIDFTPSFPVLFSTPIGKRFLHIVYDNQLMDLRGSTAHHSRIGAGFRDVSTQSTIDVLLWWFSEAYRIDFSIEALSGYDITAKTAERIYLRTYGTKTHIGIEHINYSHALNPRIGFGIEFPESKFFGTLGFGIVF